MDGREDRFTKVLQDVIHEEKVVDRLETLHRSVFDQDGGRISNETVSSVSTSLLPESLKITTFTKNMEV